MVSVSFQGLHDVHVLHRRLVHVRVFLDRADQVRNARRRCSQFGSAVRRSRPMRRFCTSAARAVPASSAAKRLFQRLRLEIRSRQVGRELPQIVLPVTAQQRIELFFQIAGRERIRGGPSDASARLQIFDLRFLRGGEVAAPEVVTRVADCFSMSRSWLVARFAADAGLFSSCARPAESFPRAASRSFCCSQPRGLPDPVRHHAHEALRQLRHFLHKIGKLRCRKSQRAAIGDGSRRRP